MELRKLDTEWETKDSGEPDLGRYKRFREFYIKKMTIMVDDNVSAQINTNIKQTVHLRDKFWVSYQQ